MKKRVKSNLQCIIPYPPPAAQFCTKTGFALTASISPTQESKLFNIVGYTTINRANQYALGGSMFASVGTAQATYSLDDFKIEGITEETMMDCTIQFLQAAQPRTDNNKYYWYAPASVAGDEAGWYSVGGFDKVPDAAKTIPAGMGFLVNFPAGASTAKLVYAGEVQTGSEGVIKFGRSAAGQYALLTNPLPYDVPLAQLKIEGITEETMMDCTIQFLQGGQPRTDNNRYYWYAPESVAGDQAGWYIVGGFDPVTVPETIKAGEGVLANFTVTDAKLVFPAPAVAK